MSQARAVTWVLENRWISAGVAFLVLAAAIAFAVFSGSEDAERLVNPREEAAVTAAPDDKATEDDEGPRATGGRGSARVAVPGGAPGTDVIPGTGGGEATPCVPQKSTAVGVDDDMITIGQVVTDSNQLPQQLRPAHEGLTAFVKLFNKGGGLCKRMLKLEYRNDNLNPALHAQDMRDLANRSLAFVANESLLDQLDYDGDPPFEPRVQGGGGSVPDVGGLAFSYARSQSAWHAGVIGSVSPVLVGGGTYRFYQSKARAAGKPCTKGAVVYLEEPTRASEEQARVGQVSLEESWGAGLGRGNTRRYSTGLLDQTPQYQALVGRMRSDGMNCVFTYSDLQSSVNLAKAMEDEGVWPPSKCKLGPACFRVFHVPLSAYDEKFIRDAGDAALDVSTFIPHVPLNESGNEAMRIYLDALKAVPGARPSTFSVIGFASGVMLVEALQACPEAPTRECLMSSLRKMKDFTAGGLLGGTTPFRTTKVNFDRYGTFDWKWIFNHSTTMRVLERNGKRDFYRINPKSGFFEDTLKVARGRAA